VSQRLTDKVALITGAARGQGRAHAVRLAAEGADVIVVDLADKLPSCAPYPFATPEDLAETASLVEATGSRVLTTAVDTRDLDGMHNAVTGMARAVAAELGKHSIRVNSVHPGPVFTEMGSEEMVAAISKAAKADGNHVLMNMLTPFLPSWVAQPEDIADAVRWLAGDESKLVTAQEISVDQGSTRH
jgi:NAD(P)-dependent dehydrogenase (short-subunit alcohol dehydrogenase family)